jgi:hypothetical protein
VLLHDLRADANIAGRLIIRAHGGMSSRHVHVDQ